VDLVGLWTTLRVVHEVLRAGRVAVVTRSVPRQLPARQAESWPAAWALLKMATVPSGCVPARSIIRISAASRGLVGLELSDLNLDMP
jgi:hypothetical protein